KSTVGKLLAEKLNYQLINSSLFYRYLVLNFQYEDKKVIIAWLSKQQSEDLLSFINDIDNQKNLISDQDAVFIAQNENIRQTINKIIQDITKEKDAEVKMVLSADIEAHVNRQLKQYNIEEFTDV
ncbi:23049_t:CDS:2, partial [Racocetra persica]